MRIERAASRRAARQKEHFLPPNVRCICFVRGAEGPLAPSHVKESINNTFDVHGLCYSAPPMGLRASYGPTNAAIVWRGFGARLTNSSDGYEHPIDTGEITR